MADLGKDKESKTKNPFEASEEQIKTWKSKYKRVQEFTYVEGEVEYKCYLRNPTLNDIGLATTNSKKNPALFGKTIINSCWLDGDKEIKENDDAILSMSNELDDLIHVGKTVVKTL
jgi:hypothetical protein